MGSLVGLRMELRRIGAATAVIAMHGELDAFTAPKAKAQLLALLEEGRRHLVLNLRQMDFIDSTGLSVLISALRRAHERGGSIRLVSPVHHVRRLFEITRLTFAFPIDASVVDALAQLHREEAA